MQVHIGYYVVSHEDCKITNNLKEQTVNGTCLGPTTNSQGSYKNILKYGAHGYTQAENKINPNANLDNSTR